MTQLTMWLASFRLRTLFRTAFLALALAVVAMAVTVLQEEKQRSYDNYQASLGKTKEQIVARLHHPAGQLALLNPRRDARSASNGQPVVLPYSAIDFDDQNKVQNAVEMANCLVQYPQHASLCVGVGSNPWTGGFIYAAGTFASGQLVAHRIGDEILDGAHRLRVTASVRGQTYRWLAPFEPLTGYDKGGGAHGRFTGYVLLDGRDYTGAKPVKEFRGWVWQDDACLNSAQGGSADCQRKSFFSLRLPVDVLRDALFRRDKPVWPPPDLDQFKVRIEVLAPGEQTTLFDSDTPYAAPLFSLDSLGELLLPGESLRISRSAGKEGTVFQTAGRDEALAQSSPLITRLIRRLPVEKLEAPVVELTDEVTTPFGRYGIVLQGDARSVNKVLGAVATRVSWFVGAMLCAIGLAWLVIEIGIIRRIAQLTKRTRGLSKTVYAEGELEGYDLADLRGNDELGILATALYDLLRRIKVDVEREKIRAEQEKNMWHAVGHEIMSPLQSLLALHGGADDPSHRYISRMQQAVRILYGSASPSEAFESSRLNVSTVDLAGFARNVAANAGIANVDYVGPDEPLLVRADDFALEDVFTHLIKNADRHRSAGTPVIIELNSNDSTAVVSVHNTGSTIPDELLLRIFEYGVSEQPANGSRGQGLFVARTYMAKMGGTITARNVEGGVCFELTLPKLIG